MADAATPCSPRDIVRSVPYRANDARAHRDTEGESTRQEHTTRVWYRLYRSSRSQVVRSYVSIHADRVRKDPPWLSLAAPVPHYMEYGEHHRVGERWDGRPLSMPDTRHAGHIARNSLRNGGVANEWNRIQHGTVYKPPLAHELRIGATGAGATSSGAVARLAGGLFRRCAAT